MAFWNSLYVLGTCQGILETEDRDLFAKMLVELGEPSSGAIATDMQSAIDAAEDIGYPV